MSQGKMLAPITQLLQQWHQGDDGALEQLTPVVYAELNQLAARFMRKERAGHTLGAGDLVNEAFLKLVAERERNFESRLHFFAVASLIMKNFLAQYARAYKTQKRGGDFLRVTLGADDQLSESHAVLRIEFLTEAIEVMGSINQRSAQALEMFYYVGLSVDEIAEVLSIGPATVKRDLRFARAWLKRRFVGGPRESAAQVVGP